MCWRASNGSGWQVVVVAQVRVDKPGLAEVPVGACAQVSTVDTFLAIISERD